MGTANFGRLWVASAAMFNRQRILWLLFADAIVILPFIFLGGVFPILLTDNGLFGNDLLTSAGFVGLYSSS